MSKDFIRRLKAEGDIRIVVPSIDASEAYSDKSREYMIGTKILFKEQLYDQAITHSYYSMYYKILSLLYLVGLKCENHAGAIILLKEIFGIDNRFISHAKTERIDKQYTITKATWQETVEMISKGEDFNSMLDMFTDQMTHKDRIFYINKAESLK